MSPPRAAPSILPAVRLESGYNNRPVPRIWLALAVLFCGAARGAAPAYSAAGIVSTASYAPGPFASNTLITIFGSGLARSPHGVTLADLVNNSSAQRVELHPRDHRRLGRSPAIRLRGPSQSLDPAEAGQWTGKAPCRSRRADQGPRWPSPWWTRPLPYFWSRRPRHRDPRRQLFDYTRKARRRRRTDRHLCRGDGQDRCDADQR